jgi:diguanylate cyclase (GGDEF)-like protein/PAS domain S-box-containing protein
MNATPYGPLANVIDLLLDAICVVDADGRFVFVSAAFERVFGYTPAEVIGTPMIDLVFPADRERTLQAAAEIMHGHPKLHFHNRYVRKDGQVIHILWSARWSEVDQVRVAVAHDITELKRAESAQAALLAISEAAHSAEDLLALFRCIHQIIGELLPASNFFVALHDREKDELSFPYFVDAYNEPPASCKLDAGMLSAEVIRTGQALLQASGDADQLSRHSLLGIRSLNWLGVPLTTQKGVIGVLVVQSYSDDVRYTESDKQLLQFVSAQVAAAIERKQTDTWLQYIARHDQLTELPNRELFHDRMQAALDQAQREQRRLSLLYIDLDNFKQANDTCGHDIGDLLLREAARRITHCVRESDTVGRVGGDEFVVLLNGIGVPEHAAAVAEAICASLSQPFELLGHRLCLSASIGIAAYPEHGDENKQLLRHADEAMYAAKRQGGNRARIAELPDAAGDHTSATAQA